MEAFRSGFVVILGPTNSGKSTLLNALIGEKISIVSHKPQTTYHGIRGILSTPEYQMVFTDTPGIQKYPQSIPRMLNRVAENHVEGCDAALWVFDVSNPRVLSQIERMASKIEKYLTKEKRIGILNKIDLVKKEQILPLLAELDKRNLFGELFPMSARKGANVEELKRSLVARLPEGPAMYPTDQITDRRFPFRVSELVREKIYGLTHEEVPYSVYIDVEQTGDNDEEAKPKVPTIHAQICVDSDSRKGILIGKKAERLKKIGILARKDIEKMTGQKVCLKLHVKVDPNWTEDSRKVQRYLELS